MKLVEEETRRYRQTKNYLEYLPQPKTSFEVICCKNVMLMGTTEDTPCRLLF